MRHTWWEAGFNWRNYTIGLSWSRQFAWIALDIGPFYAVVYPRP